MERETLSYKHFDCFIGHFAKTNDHFVLSLSLISQRTIINLFIQLSTLSLKYLSYCVRKYPLITDETNNIIICYQL